MFYLYLVIAAGVLLLFYMFIEAFRNRLIHHPLTFEELPEGLNSFRIFFISDIHKRRVSERLINKLTKPVDIVIIGGDLLEAGVKQERLEKNLRQLTKLAPVYFVWGNNDEEVDKQWLETTLLRHGVTILSQSSEIITKSESRIQLIGIDEEYEQLDQREINNEMFTVLISHYPDIIREASSMLSPELSLSGHTHGGQIRLIRFGIAELGGMKRENGGWHLISNGYGTTKLPLRLGAPQQTHIIEIKK
ncbi:metallophosphoesterase [Alkalihalophilus pseudofirmus]|uniref:Metallophosphoesterase n=1 Tax=Alkalihalophilus pseudofirmus TaxID=79885 RepID=A0AAJ2KSR8_ALKPS|nr:metallophosphoesterase [Alkalihalophilus pseudofirmus]MDV2884292.1 metallophosphoesterase [Alkalihalophilus pseudofirmus]